jgi:pyrroline-5-carboxylate reductase
MLAATVPIHSTMPPIPDSRLPIPVKIAFIGGGNMARCLIGALVHGGTPPAAIAVAEPHPELRAALARDFGVAVHATAAAAAGGADVLVLAVKPQIMKTVCAELAAGLAGRRPLVISIAAGIRIAQLRDWLGADLPIVRSMPNTPARPA